MWKPSRRAFLTSLSVLTGAGYGGGRFYCNETSCADEQNEYLVSSPLNPAWKKQFYDPCKFCRNDSGDKFDSYSFVVGATETAWTAIGGVASRDPASGAIDWEVDITKYTLPYAIAHTEETVFIVGGTTGSSHGQQLAAVDRETGEILDDNTLPESPIETDPVIDTETETVCREANQTDLLAYNARTGDFHWGTDDFNWTTDFSIQNTAAGGGNIYLSGVDAQDQATIVALDSRSGVPKWSQPVEARIVSLDCSGDRIYAVYGTNRDGKPGAVLCFDMSDGEGNWQYPLSRTRNYDLSIDGDSVVLTEQNSGIVRVLDAASGQERLVTQVNARITGPPGVTNNSVFVPYDHSNNPALPQVEHGLLRFDIDSEERTGRRVFYDEIAGIAATNSHVLVLSGPAIWGFN